MHSDGVDVEPATPAGAAAPRQKRRPGSSRRPGSGAAGGGSSRTAGAGHHHHHHHHRHSPHSLQRKVSFDVSASASSAGSGRSKLRRHASFDPRLGMRADAPGGGASGGRSRGGGSREAAWAKLVTRAQVLEEELASERASRRLLAARAAADKKDLEARLAKASEERGELEELWRDGKLQFASKLAEWDSERLALYGELSRLRGSA